MNRISICRGIFGVPFCHSLLANGRFKAKPDPYVVDHGIEYIQHGMDAQKKVCRQSKLSSRLDVALFVDRQQGRWNRHFLYAPPGEP